MQRDRQTDRRTERHTDTQRQTDMRDRQTQNRQTDTDTRHRQADRQMCIHMYSKVIGRTLYSERHSDHPLISLTATENLHLMFCATFILQSVQSL